MRIFTEGATSQAICQADGRVTTTFRYRDVPFDDGSGIVKNILVGVCDRCAAVVAIPPQSTPAIKASKRRAEHPLEVSLPATSLDILDAACYRIDPEASPDMRKRLLFFYIERFSEEGADVTELATLMAQAQDFTQAMHTTPPKRRLSLKITATAKRKLDALMARTGLTATELCKALIEKIHTDIVIPERPEHLRELLTLAAVLHA